MGLDVWLEKHPDYSDKKRREDKGKPVSDRLWAKIVGKDVEYKDAPKKKVDEWRAAMTAEYKKLGLDEWGSDAREEKVEIDSAKYPDHLFKIGYFRSSYNESGINRYLEDLLGTDLYQLFGVDHDEYEFFPDWEGARVRVVQALEQYETIVAEGKDFKVEDIRFSPFKDPKELPTSSKEALEMYLEEREQHDGKDFQSYSSSRGQFWHEGFPVYALIPGMAKSLFRQDIEPVMYMVRKMDSDGWYKQALEIVLETIDYVLAQEDSENYYLVWSS